MSLNGSTISEVGDGSPRIELDELKEDGEITHYKKTFSFTPEQNRNDDGFVEYVIVDPVLSTANSNTSNATIKINPINDAPTNS